MPREKAVDKLKRMEKKNILAISKCQERESSGWTDENGKRKY